MLESLLHDLRYGARTLRKSPGFTIVAAITLALGIGGCAAMYAYIQQLVLSEAPYPNLDSLVIVQEVDSLDPDSNRGISAKAFTHFADDGRYIAHIGGYTTDGFVLMDSETLPILDGALVTPNIFEILGMKPLLGRTFSESEARANEHVVVLGERAWRLYFAARPEIVGETINLSRKLYTVIGVMPAGFWRGRDVWTPLGVEPSSAGRLRTWARLSRPKFHDEARAELDLLTERLASDDPSAQGSWKLTVLNPFQMSSGQLGTLGALLVAPVGLVFLIACVNIAHLQFGRDIQRRREMAVRLSMGATRLRLTRQLLTESLLLALLGGALGVIFASWGVNAIGAYLPAGNIELMGGPELDRDALLFLVLLSAASSIVFGLLPALRVSGLGLATALKAGSRNSTSSSFRSWLLISELAFSTMLLVGTGMMGILVQHKTHADMGFDTSNLWSARLSLRGPIRFDDGAKRNWSTTTLRQIQAVPGVVSAAFASELPLLGGSKRQFEALGQTPADGAATQAEYRAVSPAYFETLRVRLLHGRVFNDDDREGSAPVAILNETMARQFFPEGALGRRLRVLPETNSAGSNPVAPPVLREIVGVVADVRQEPIDALPPPPMAYAPHRQDPIAPLSLVVRSQGSPDAVGRAVLDEINAPSAEVIVQSVFVFERAIRDRVRATSFFPFSMAVFAALGLLLTAVGLYGTTNRAVAQRTRELGIRQALGARANDLLRLVLGQSARGGGAGLVIGLAGSFLAANLFLRLLGPRERAAFGADLLGASDTLLVSLGTAILLVGIILIATYLPARRATKSNP